MKTTKELLQEMATNLPKMLLLVLEYREGLIKAGVPGNEILQLVSSFQTSLLTGVMIGQKQEEWDK